MLCRRVSFTEQTRLEHAIKSENVAELSAVLDGGASPNTLILQGECALHHSVIKNCEESTKALLDKGAHVNLQDETGCTALHYAIANNNIAITQLIIEAGGSLFLADDQGILPTAFSKSKEMTDFLNDKIFDSTLHNLQNMFNKPDVSHPNKRRNSEGDCENGVPVRQKRARSFSDSGVPKKSCLKKVSQFAPKEIQIDEVRESQESLTLSIEDIISVEKSRKRGKQSFIMRAIKARMPKR